LLCFSDLLLDSFPGVTPSIFAAFADISGGFLMSSGGGDRIPVPSATDCRRELDRPLVLDRFSEVDFDRDNGGALLNMLEMPRDFGGRSTFSALSDAESFDEDFSSFSDDFFVDLDRFKSESLDLFSSFAVVSSGFLSLEDFFFSSFSSFRGAAPHAPQELPSRTTRGRSFFDDLGSGGGVGGPAGTALGSLSLLDDLLFLLDLGSAGISRSSRSSSPKSVGKLPGTSLDLDDFFGDAFFSSAISLSFLDVNLEVLEDLDFLSSTGGGGGGGGGGAGASTSFCDSNAFRRSAILPPTGFLFNADAFIGVEDDLKDVVVSLEVAASGSFDLSAAISSLPATESASFLAASVPLPAFLVAPQNPKTADLSSTTIFSLGESRSISGSGSGSGSGSSSLAPFLPFLSFFDFLASASSFSLAACSSASLSLAACSSASFAAASAASASSAFFFFAA
jgi:hypothetical protein